MWELGASVGRAPPASYGRQRMHACICSSVAQTPCARELAGWKWKQRLVMCVLHYSLFMVNH